MAADYLTHFSTADDPRTAHHEAGHAVLMLALGLGCEGVTIVPDFDSLEAGSAVHGGEYGREATELREQDDDVAHLRRFAPDAFHLRHAIALYAGAEATRRWGPTLDDWKVGTESDYTEAADRINSITDDSTSIDLLYAYAARRSFLLVEHYWPEICAIATALLRKRTLKGEEVSEIFAQFLVARRGGLMSW